MNVKEDVLSVIHMPKLNMGQTRIRSSSLKIFFCLTIVLIFLPLFSAITVNVSSNFAQGETLLAKISGNFVDQVKTDNVFFYRGHVEIPMTFDVIKIGNDFYIYALLTEKAQGNYSFYVKDVRYYSSTQVIDDDFGANFTISNSTAAFSLTPGVVSTTGSGFSVELQNLLDKSITVKIESAEEINSVSSINLNVGETKTVSFTLDSQATQGLSPITFSAQDTTYEMPVYLNTGITGENNSSSNNNSSTKEIDFEFQPKTVSIALATESETRRILYIKNTGDIEIKNILISAPAELDPYVTVSPSEISSLDPGETVQITLEIESDSEEQSVKGTITAEAEDAESSFYLTLDFVKDFIPSNDDDLLIATTCEDLQGIVCDAALKCSGDIIQSKNGDCCIAPLVCQEPKQSSSKKIIGWGLIVLVLILAFWFYRSRYRSMAMYRPRPF